MLTYNSAVNQCFPQKINIGGGGSSTFLIVTMRLLPFFTFFSFSSSPVHLKIVFVFNKKLLDIWYKLFSQ